ncbi:TPA: transposase [Klebsiella quasipneumoniae subsp. similipneumoniae]|nr:transposase [Klebsiella quasipneumoniae subsp. similipneumoniae]
MILGFIKSGKPTQNASTKRFNLTYLTEIVDLHPFRMPNEAREITRVEIVIQTGALTITSLQVCQCCIPSTAPGPDVYRPELEYGFRIG